MLAYAQGVTVEILDNVVVVARAIIVALFVCLSRPRVRAD
jgi:hypothetical protein